jgi:hypothetical protein
LTWTDVIALRRTITSPSSVVLHRFRQLAADHRSEGITVYRPFTNWPKALAAAAGLAVAVSLAVGPAQAESRPSSQSPTTTGRLGQGAAPGGPVTRDQVIARAKDWVKQRVPYSQSRAWRDDATGGPYRQDCSGFVSMAWQLKDSLTTQSLPRVANTLPGFSQLEAGDVLDYPAGHAILFGGWTDRAKGDFVYYSESRSGRPARRDSANIHDNSIAGHPRTWYIPLRYKKIHTTPARPATPSPTPSRSAAPAPSTPSKRPAPSAPAAAAAPAPGGHTRPSSPAAVAAPTPTRVPLAKPAADVGGTSFAATATRLYAISPDHSAVYEYTGQGDGWMKVRGRTSRIYTSGSTLYATSSRGNIYRYDRARETWKRIGGPGAEFAATAKHLYGTSPDRSAVYEYTGKGDRWVKVRTGRTGRIHTSAGTLYATNARGDIEQYDRARKKWTRIGGPGADFAATRDRLYGASPDYSGVYAYTGTPGAWVRIGGPLAR